MIIMYIISARTVDFAGAHLGACILYRQRERQRQRERERERERERRTDMSMLMHMQST